MSREQNDRHFFFWLKLVLPPVRETEEEIYLRSLGAHSSKQRAKRRVQRQESDRTGLWGEGRARKEQLDVL